MPEVQISVAICSHNPRADYLGRTLEALENQTLAQELWEVILVDNASQPPLKEKVDFEWHPHGKFIAEPELGLTNARKRAFASSRADLIVLVDDDNVLADDYLQNVLDISQNHPELGAWGASIEGEFEKPVPAWLERELIFLAVRPISKDSISLKQDPKFQTPAGAGICVRRDVFEKYLSYLEGDSRRKKLDRKGSSLVSSGDTDLAMTAWDIGLGLANFQKLRLKHLIPGTRMSYPYLKKLHKSMGYSSYLLSYVRGESLDQKIPSRSRVIKTQTRDFLKLKWRQIGFFSAHMKGLLEAQRELSGE